MVRSLDKLVYLSPVPWSSFAQRPHFLVRDYVDQTGGRVLWVDPYPGRLPRLEDLRPRSGGNQSGRLQKSDLLRSVQIIRPRALPVEPLAGLNRLNHLLWKPVLSTVRGFVKDEPWLLGIGRPTRLAAQLLETSDPTTSFYDAMDDFPEFYSGRSRSVSVKLEERIASRVDRVVVSSSYLQSKFEHSARQVRLVRNGCDPTSLPPPGAAAGKRPVFGYLGTLGRWLDWERLQMLARENPEADFELVGPDFGARPVGLPPNVRLRGACSQDEVGARLSKFNVGLIPFELNALTRSVDPIKYYEYRAMGLPVLSTSFGDMPGHAQADSGIFLLEGPGSQRKAVSRALAYRDEAAGIEDFRHQHSWSRRFAALEDIFHPASR